MRNTFILIAGMVLLIVNGASISSVDAAKEATEIGCDILNLAEGAGSEVAGVTPIEAP